MNRINYWLFCFSIAIGLILGLVYFPNVPEGFPYAIADLHSSHLVTFEGEAMTMSYRICVEAPIDAHARMQCEAAIKKGFDRIDAIFNRWNPHSQLSNFNHQLETTPMSIEPDLFQLLTLADKVWQVSEGLYDPTITRVTKLWRRYLEKGQVPPQDEREAATALVGWNCITLAAPNQISKCNKQIQIDLSSIAKGQGVDLICENLQKLGFKHIFVEWGGEIRVFGNHPDHRKWAIGIKAPRIGQQVKSQSETRSLAKIELEEGAIATSGHDGLYWVVTESEGRLVTYSHLFHAKKALPLRVEERIILSCTVVAPNCALADALATAGLLFDSEEQTQAWAERVTSQWPEVSLFFFTRDQQLWHYSGKKSQIHTTGTIELYHRIHN